MEYNDWESYEHFQEEFKNMEFRDETQNFEESFYLELIQRFVKTGEVPESMFGDLIADYLVTVMQDSWLQVQVLSSEVCARIFEDNMMRFVDAALRRKKFDINRAQSEIKGMSEALEWSQKKKEDGWQALLQKLDESYSQYGFRSAFYQNQFSTPEGRSKDELWESLNKDYHIAFNEYLRQRQQQDIQQRDSSARKRLENQMRSIPDYLASHSITTDDFMQTWGLMGGEWNEYDFERLLRIAKMQKEYPVLQKLALKMGRMLDPDGDDAIYAGFGSASKMQHSSKSDIEGVSIGNDINALLPLEMAQMMDDDLGDLFTYKFATRSLQTFQHRSEMLCPSRHLERKRARQRGPMIVAIDTSGSMQGKPQNIARSILMKLIDISRRQHRDLFIIAFSVSARPIDAHRNYVQLLDFFSHDSSGDTNATKMIEQVHSILQSNPSYMSADVLIISDFHLPLVSPTLLNAIEYHRIHETKFYGLQIGETSHNKWPPYLDKIYKVDLYG